jgi:hypothetical protein
MICCHYFCEITVNSLKVCLIFCYRLIETCSRLVNRLSCMPSRSLSHSNRHLLLLEVFHLFSSTLGSAYHHTAPHLITAMPLIAASPVTSSLICPSFPHHHCCFVVVMSYATLSSCPLLCHQYSPYCLCILINRAQNPFCWLALPLLSSAQYLY